MVIANKLNKIRRASLRAHRRFVRHCCVAEEVPVIPFSVEKGFGRDEVLDLIFVTGKEEAYDFSAVLWQVATA